MQSSRDCRDHRGVRSYSPPDPTRSLHRLILLLRVSALLIGAVLVTAAVNLMTALAWQIDVLIASVATLGWAYVFERGQE